MNRKEFAKFYAVGLDFTSRTNPPTMYNEDCDEIDPETSPNEYAFYFAKQCCADVDTRGMKEWGKMPWLKWALLYRLPSLIVGLFRPKKAKKSTTKEMLMAMVESEGEHHA